MTEGTSQERKAGGFTAANGPTPNSHERKRNACATTRFERSDLLILFGLAIVTFGIYAQVIGHRFINLDDPAYITENSMVNRGVTLDGLAWAFTTFHFGYWHPLTWIAHMIDSQLFGMFAGGHLLVNALFHVADTLLIFGFCWERHTPDGRARSSRRFLRCIPCTWNRSLGRANSRVRFPHFSAYCR